MEAELIVKMLDCIAEFNRKIKNATESAKRDVDRTHCRIQDDTIAKWENAVAAMEVVVAPYKTWALEWKAQQQLARCKSNRG